MFKSRSPNTLKKHLSQTVKWKNWSSSGSVGRRHVNYKDSKSREYSAITSCPRMLSNPLLLLVTGSVIDDATFFFAITYITI